MKKLGLLVMCLLPLPAYSEVMTEVYCFSSADKAPKNFEFRFNYDTSAKWTVGYLKYADAPRQITLAARDAQWDESDPQRPDDVADSWLEVTTGKVTGEYEMVTEAGAITAMVYTRYADKNKTTFNRSKTVEGSLENGCQW